MSVVILARNAMNTRFELVLHGDNPVALQAAGEEALAEVERIENLLSIFRPFTELAHLNARAGQEAVRVSPEVFAFLETAQRLSAETGGAFDMTTAPLLRYWGMLGRVDGRVPGEAELESARAVVGMHLVELDQANRTVRFAKPGVMLDPGAIGKGYALDKAVECLRDAGVTSALLHGGTSTVFALGAPPDADAWRVALEWPGLRGKDCPPPGPVRLLATEMSPQPLARIPLRDQSLSVSAVSGKSFQVSGETYGHVLDPRTGRTASNAVMAAVVLPSSTETDALSTALLVAGAQGHEAIAVLRPQMRTVLLSRANDGGVSAEARGIELMAPAGVR